MAVYGNLASLDCATPFTDYVIYQADDDVGSFVTFTLHLVNRHNLVNKVSVCITPNNTFDLAGVVENEVHMQPRQTLERTGLQCSPGDRVIIRTTQGNVSATMTGVASSDTIVVPGQSPITQTPSYTFTAHSSSVTEGQTISFDIEAKNVPDGTSIPYTLSGITDPGEIGGNSLTGAMIVEDERANKSFNVPRDGTTDTQTVTMTLDGGEASPVAVEVVNAPETGPLAWEPEVIEDTGEGGGGGPVVTPPLYDFETHTFTNAGATGRNGPTSAQVTSAYSAVSWAAENISVETQGFQRWTVPDDGTYEIDVRGASGLAYSSSNRRGYGYRLKGNFTLTREEILEIAVGQGGWGAGGSGGGTFVVAVADDGSRDPLIIAGGGGGQDGRYTHTNGDAVSTTSGVNSTDGYSGGSNGSGGSGPSSNGGAGGGYLGNGASTPNNGGYGYLQGGSTFNANSLYGGNGGGGFGGGGGSTDDQGSGGGGYSGGAGTSENSTGGGGGSYFNGTRGESRVNVGNTSDTHGQVIITKIA
jgi:hypothetical protein